MKVHIITASVAVMALMTACNNTDSSKTSENKDTAVVVTSDRMDKTVTVKTVEVTPVIKTKFETKYPKATEVQWTKYESVPMDLDWELTGWPALDTMDYAAKYTIDNTDYWTWYTPEGEWIATVSTINVAGVPDAVNKTLQSQFEGYTVTSVNKENDKNRTAYEVKMEKGEDKMKALIDEKGNIMKKKGKENGVKVKEKNI
ncbi:PepSY-like domain-containing protein [Ferruginibacter sp.]